MAPILEFDEHMANAFKAANSWVISENEIEPVILKLLHAFGGRWEQIESHNNRILINAYFDEDLKCLYKSLPDDSFGFIKHNLAKDATKNNTTDKKIYTNLMRRLRTLRREIQKLPPVAPMDEIVRSQESLSAVPTESEYANGVLGGRPQRYLITSWGPWDSFKAQVDYLGWSCLNYQICGEWPFEDAFPDTLKDADS